jgi:tRNA dimethylallyltransferase
VEQAHAALAREDPDRAAALHPADTTRVARALEVVRSTGHPLAHWQARREGGIGHAVALRPLVLLPDRAWLYARCDLRFARMWEGGALAEVEALLARRLDPDLPVMRAIGVPESPPSCAAKATPNPPFSPASKPRGAMPSGSSPGPGTSFRRMAARYARKLP